MTNIDLVILCGGKGSRLKSFTKKTPKPLLKINNITFLDNLISYYQKYDFKNIYLLAGYLGEKIKKKYENKSVNFINLKVIVEKSPKGTGGALNLIKNKVKNNFVLINGDSFVEYDLLKFCKLENKFLGKMLLVKNKKYKSNKQLSSLKLLKNSVCYSNSSNYMNAGVYFFSNKIFHYINGKTFSLEKDILHRLIHKKLISGQYTEGYFIDIGLKQNLFEARKNLNKILTKPAVFLDRDGVINKDLGYVGFYKDFKWKRDTVKFLKFLNKKNYYIFIVTNQSGIGRGYYTEADFFNLHSKVKKYLSKKNIFIDDVKFCPNHPIHGIGKYKVKCKFRKPGNLMIETILKEWNVKLSSSFMIGDKISDYQCAKKSKLKFFYYNKNIYKELEKKLIK